MNSDSLDALAVALVAQTADVTTMFEGNSDDVLQKRPLPKKWSVAEHTEHLNMVNKLYLVSIDGAVRDARNKGWLHEGPYGGTWLAEKLIQSMEPPPKQRVPTFRKAVPPPKLDCSDALAGFTDTQTEAVTSLEAAKGLDLGKARFRSPLFPLLKLSAMQGYRLIETHNRRHMWHMEQALHAITGA